jgi:hypothetical protein
MQFPRWNTLFMSSQHFFSSLQHRLSFPLDRPPVFPSSGKSFFRRAEEHFGRKNSLRPQGFYIFVSANETNPILRNQAKVQTKKNP